MWPRVLKQKGGELKSSKETPTQKRAICSKGFGGSHYHWDLRVHPQCHAKNDFGILWPPPKNWCQSLHYDHFFGVCPLLDLLKMLGKRKLNHLKWWFDDNLPWYKNKNSPETNPTIIIFHRPKCGFNQPNYYNHRLLLQGGESSLFWMAWEEKKPPPKNPDPSKMAILYRFIHPSIGGSKDS